MRKEKTVNCTSPVIRLIVFSRILHHTTKNELVVVHADLSVRLPFAVLTILT